MLAIHGMAGEGKITRTVRLSKDLAARIDKARGLVSWEAWARETIVRRLDDRDASPYIRADGSPASLIPGLGDLSHGFGDSANRPEEPDV